MNDFLKLIFHLKAKGSFITRDMFWFGFMTYRNLNGLHLSSYIQVYQSLYQSFGDST